MFKENNSKLLVFHKDKPDFIELYKSNIVSSGISVIASFTFDESEYHKVRLTNTKIYFEQIIVPYCQQNFASIIKTINDQNIQNQFRNNFEQRNSKQEPTKTTHNDFDDGHLEEELIPKNHKKSCFFIFRKICVYMTLILFAIFICFMLCFMVKEIIHFF